MAPDPPSPSRRRAIADIPFVRIGIYAWAAAGVVLLLWVVARVAGVVHLVVVPLMLALFPAALLSPLQERLARSRLPRGAAAGVLVLAFVVLLFGVVSALGWLVGHELDEVVDALREAYADVERLLRDRFDVGLPNVDELFDRAQQWAERQDLGEAGRAFATTTLEVLSGFALFLLALFFYLKDGPRIADFFLFLTPAAYRDEAAEIGRRVWETLGGYFRGQILVAAVDGVLVGVGLAVLGVPLALPLGVLVFIGGLFPIVGAFAAGALAVLVALADAGLARALAVLALNVAVQQAEGNLLEPVIVGRATRLHPLVVIGALTAGAVTTGILGAFLAVPAAAAAVRVVGFYVERTRDGETDDNG